MNKIEINKGDMFVYHSKYGGRVVDTIDSFTVVHVLKDDGLLIADYGVRSSKGIPYKLSEIQIVSKEFSDEEFEAIKTTLEKIRGLKGIPLSEKMAIMESVKKFNHEQDRPENRQHR